MSHVSHSYRGACPFCGSSRSSEGVVLNTGGNLHFFECRDCHAHGPWSTLSAGPLELWNKRHAGPGAPNSGSVGPWKECVYKHPDAPKVLTAREEGYLDRMHERCDILRARIGDGTSNANFISEWRRELTAFEWALSRLGATGGRS